MRPEHPADSAGIRYDQLQEWFTAEEACAHLGNCSPRWLRERIADGKWHIERLERTRLTGEGFKTEPARPCFNREDVLRVAKSLEKRAEAKAMVFAGDSGVGPRKSPPDVPATVPPAVDLVRFFDQVNERGAELVRRLLPAASDRGPWLTIKAASAEYGIPPATLRQIAKMRYAAKDPDVYCAAKGWRIRRAAVASIDAQELEVADASRPKRLAPVVTRKAAVA
jgi:hypothetical protein